MTFSPYCCAISEYARFCQKCFFHKLKILEGSLWSDPIAVIVIQPTFGLTLYICIVIGTVSVRLPAVLRTAQRKFWLKSAAGNSLSQEGTGNLYQTLPRLDSMIDTHNMFFLPDLMDLVLTKCNDMFNRTL